MDCLPSSPLSHDPYTPSKKIYDKDRVDTVKTPDIGFLEYDESTHSPKPISEKETNETLSTNIAENTEIEQTNDTCYSADSNCHENLPQVVIDTDYKAQSWLNVAAISKDGIKSKASTIISSAKDAYLRNESGQFTKTKEIQNHCASKETKRDMVSQAENLKKPRERCKSEDFLFKLNDEKAKENNRSKRKKLKREKNYSHHPDNKIANLAILDEILGKLSPETKKIEQRNKSGNVNKELHKRTVEPVGNPYYHQEPNKMVSDNTPSEKQHANLLTENEATLSYGIEKRSAKTAHSENDKSCESNIEMSPENVPERQRKLKSSSKYTVVSVRRSERSPSKPKRFIEEQNKVSTKSEKKHKSYKMYELFGTDDDEEHLFETKKDGINNNYKQVQLPFSGTPVSKKPVECSPSSSLKKTKRKSDKSTECQQEKREMVKWLSKKNSKPSDHAATTTSKSTSKSSLSKPLPLNTLAKGHSQPVTPPPMTIELPSKEELESMRNKTNLMREENARIKAELDKMRIPPPKEVEILSLQNVSDDKLLSTFSTYKNELDEIYQSNHKRDYIKGHDGINHCFIIKLLQQSTQMKMLQKLTDIYGSSNTTRQATLFANALLPEWVIRVYMEEFNFTRQQAIDQIKAQEAFQLHMEEQNESAFEFD